MGSAAEKEAAFDGASASALQVAACTDIYRPPCRSLLLPSVSVILLDFSTFLPAVASRSNFSRGSADIGVDILAGP